MNKACILIPVYKQSPSKDEITSITQTLHILKKYDIFLVCPDSLDIKEYLSLSSDSDTVVLVSRFADAFFQDIHGYNRLLLSLDFYLRFSNYNFMLISQPDAYVFRDELSYWCDKAFDFIGAPLVGKYEDVVFSKAMRVGNGGFSLRNVQTAINFFYSKKNVFAPKQIAQRISLWKKPWSRFFVWILMVLGWRNKPSSVASEWKYNEDDFWSGLLTGTRYQLKMPEISDAIRFSFERFPSELYDMNHNQLPFGCHAWKKYQYDAFWSQFIN